MFSKQNLQYLTIFLVALCLALVFICLDKDAVDLGKGDTEIYAKIAKNLASGNGFSDKKLAPFSPTMSREPLYPLFLGIIFYLFSGSIFAVQIIQALIYALTCILIFKIISYTGLDNKFSFRVSLAIAIFPTLANYCACILTEVLFTFLLALMILFLSKGFKNQGAVWYFYSGLILGTASLCRAVVLFYAFFAIFFIVLNCLKKTGRLLTPKIIKYYLLFLFGFFLVITPWLMRNYFVLGKFGITVRGYDALYTRAAKVNLNNQELKMYAVYSLSEHLANKLYPGHDLYSVYTGYFYQPFMEKYNEYLRRGLSAQDADTEFQKESVTLIRAHPVRFLTMGIFEIIKLNSFSQIPLLNIESTKKFFGDNLILPVLRGALKLIGFLIFILAIAGMIITRGKWMVMLSVILYFNLIHSFFDAIGRYAAPIIPYYIFFACLVFLPKLKLNTDNSEKCAE